VGLDDTDESAGFDRASETEQPSGPAAEAPQAAESTAAAAPPATPPAADPPRRPAPKLVVKIVGGPEDWDRARGQTASPGSQVGEQLPTFDASFFDAVPTTPSVEADETFQPVAVTAGRGDDRTYGDFLGEPEPVDLHDDDPVVTPRTVGMVGAVHASSIGHIDTHVPPVMYDFEPDVEGAAAHAGHPKQTSRTRRRARVAGPVLAVAAVVIWVLVMAGSGRPSLNSAGSGDQAATGQTSTTAGQVLGKQASAPKADQKATAPNTPAATATDANAALAAAGGTPTASVTPVTESTSSGSSGGNSAGRASATPVVRNPAPATKTAPAPTAAPRPAPAPTSAPKPTPTTAPPATVAPPSCAAWMQGCS
jgi:hypothetical protein